MKLDDVAVSIWNTNNLTKIQQNLMKNRNVLYNTRTHLTDNPSIKGRWIWSKPSLFPSKRTQKLQRADQHHLKLEFVSFSDGWRGGGSVGNENSFTPREMLNDALWWWATSFKAFFSLSYMYKYTYVHTNVYYTHSIYRRTENVSNWYMYTFSFKIIIHQNWGPFHLLSIKNKKK